MKSTKEERRILLFPLFSLSPFSLLLLTRLSCLFCYPHFFVTKKKYQRFYFQKDSNKGSLTIVKEIVPVHLEILSVFVLKKKTFSTPSPPRYTQKRRRFSTSSSSLSPSNKALRIPGGKATKRESKRYFPLFWQRGEKGGGASEWGCPREILFCPLPILRRKRTHQKFTTDKNSKYRNNVSCLRREKLFLFCQKKPENKKCLANFAANREISLLVPP